MEDINMDDITQFIIDEYKEDYIKDHNPIYVWECIRFIEGNGQEQSTEYPAWIRKYLLRTANNLRKCDHKAKGDNGIVAAFGFMGAYQLYMRDELKVSLAYAYMEALIDGDTGFEDITDDMNIAEAIAKITFGGTKCMSSELAADATERYLNNNGFQNEADSGKRGYLGSSKLQKIYRATKRVCEEIEREGLSRLQEKSKKQAR